MITYDHYTTTLRDTKLEIYFYFNEKQLIRSSFGKDNQEQQLKGATYQPHPQFIKDFELFLQGKQPFNFSQLTLKGTPFQKAVWEALRTIPRGSIQSYGEVAKKIQRPQAYRAVGLAVAKNPFPIIIPCHRILHSDKKKVGKFGGKEHIKKTLLKNEGIVLEEIH